MRKHTFIIMLMSILILAGCNRPDDECQDQEAFGWHLPKVLNEYLPYAAGQQVVFVNEAGETMTLQALNPKLLDYDTAYYTYTFNPCRPTGDLPTYGLGLLIVPEATNPNGIKKGVSLSFSGGAGGEAGQCVGISFTCVSNLTNKQLSGSMYFNGNIQDLGDTVEILANGLSAQIVKGKGLARLQDIHEGHVWVAQ